MPKPIEVRGRVVIELLTTGKITINLPQDPILAYGMLEKAKEALIAEGMRSIERGNIVRP